MLMRDGAHAQSQTQLRSRNWACLAPSPNLLSLRTWACEPRV